MCVLGQREVLALQCCDRPPCLRKSSEELIVIKVFVLRRDPKQYFHCHKVSDRLTLNLASDAVYIQKRLDLVVIRREFIRSPGKSFLILFRPPVSEISFLIELTACRIKGMRDLMGDRIADVCEELLSAHSGVV